MFQFEFVLSFGRAVLVSVRGTMNDCKNQSLSLSSCLHNLGKRLSDEWQSSSAISATSLLCLATTIALHVQLLDFQVLLAWLQRCGRHMRLWAAGLSASLRRAGEQRRLREAQRRAADPDAAAAVEAEADLGEQEAGFDSPAQLLADDGEEWAHEVRQSQAALSPADRRLLTPLLADDEMENVGDVRAGPPLWQYPYRILFFQAHDLCVLTLALTFSVVAPLILIPGSLYFVNSYAVRKWQFMSIAKETETPPDSDKHRAAATMLLYGLFVHVFTAAFFVQRQYGGVHYDNPNVGGLTGCRQFQVLAAFAVALLLFLSSSFLYKSLAPPTVNDEADARQIRAALLEESKSYGGAEGAASEGLLGDAAAEVAADEEQCGVQPRAEALLQFSFGKR